MPPKRPRSGKSSGKTPGKGRAKAAPPKERSAPAPRKGGPFPGWRLPLALVASALVLVGLLWLARREQHPELPSAPARPAVTVTEQLPAERQPAEALLPALPPPVGKPPALDRRGRVAIIVDDLGRSLPQARKLLGIPHPVTLAILPGEAHAAAVANAAHAAGREVMLHLPMEPQGYPVVDPGDDALLLAQDDATLRAATECFLARVPHAAGANNHMGSRFTEDERGMAVVMEVLRERRLFFVDSLTSSHSVGSRQARATGVPVAQRDLFLDNVAEVGAIGRELERLAERARREGSAIGICHPYPETLAVLQKELPRLAAEGIEFVKVAELVERR